MVVNLGIEIQNQCKVNQFDFQFLKMVEFLMSENGILTHNQLVLMATKSQSVSSLLLKRKHADQQKPSSKTAVKKISSLLEGMSFALINFPSEVFERYSQLISQHGGKTYDTYQPLISALVVFRMGSRECKFALDNNMAIITKEYFKDLVKQQRILPFERYFAKPFHNFVISTTGFSSEEKKSIEAMVLSNGGEFCHELIYEQTTHLIAKVQEGPKYDYAKQWGNVHIIPFAWIEDCYKHQRWFPEEDYSLTSTTPKSSTTSGKQNLVQYRKRLLEETSSRGERKIENFNNKENLLTENILNTNLVDNSIVDNPIKLQRTEPEAVSTITVSNKMKSLSSQEQTIELSTETILRSMESYLLANFDRSKLPKPRSIIESPTKSKLFYQREFFLSGYKSEVEDYLISCILAASGRVSFIVTERTEFVALSEDPTLGSYSAIAAKEVQDLREKCRQHPCGVQYINFVWILKTLFEREHWIHLLKDWSPEKPI